jgi:hypothetical protein
MSLSRACRHAIQRLSHFDHGLEPSADFGVPTPETWSDAVVGAGESWTEASPRGLPILNARA